MRDKNTKKIDLNDFFVSFTISFKSGDSWRKQWYLTYKEIGPAKIPGAWDFN